MSATENRTEKSTVLEALEKLKEEAAKRYQEDIAEIELAIAAVKKIPPVKKLASGVVILPPTISVIAGQHDERRTSWEGMGIPDAVHCCLWTHGGGPIKFKLLMASLQKHGVRLGDPSKPQRFSANVKTTIISNQRRFSYNKRKDTVMLCVRPQSVVSKEKEKEAVA